jgi:SAM-dependent methyltransferase
MPSILDFYKTNEECYFTDKNDPHNYISEIYDKVFYDLPNNINVLEIGVYTGNSIQLWADFFSNGFVYGVDNMDAFLKKPLMGKNYEILIKEAYKIETVNYFKEKNVSFDVIIEDGLHSFETQIFALENYFDLVKEGGMMIVEDIQDISHGNYMVENFNNCELIDLRHINNRYDDIAIIRRK